MGGPGTEMGLLLICEDLLGPNRFVKIFFFMEEACVIFSPFSGWKRFSRKLLKTCGEGLSGSCAKELHDKSVSQG